MSDEVERRIRDLDVPAGDVRADELWERGRARARRRVGAAVAALVVVAAGVAGAATLVDGNDDVGVATDVADDDVDDTVQDRCTSTEAFLHEDTDVIVYTQPDLSDGDHHAIAEPLHARPAVDVVADIDQDQTYDEFTQIFSDSPEIVETVSPEILPRRIELDVVSGDGTLGPLVDEITAIAGVREVMTRASMRRLPSTCEQSDPPPSDAGPTTTTFTTTTIPADGALSGEQIVGAESIVRAFLDELMRGNFAAADVRLSDYMTTDARTLAADPVLAELIAADEVDMTVTPSWSWSRPSPVVTASTRAPDGSLVASAFLIAAPDDSFSGGPIHRVQMATDVDGIDASIGSNRSFVIPGVPVEGGAIAHIGAREVRVEVDHDALETTVAIPDDVAGDVVLTVSTATPEYPTATAYVLAVG